MYAKILCYPPLGEPTVIPAGQDTVDFVVILETSDGVSSTLDKAWQVALWHNMDARGDEWSEVSFDEDSSQHDILTARTSTTRKHRAFRLSLPGRPQNGSEVRFTVKFRVSNDAPWKWVHQEFSHGDGVLLFQSAFVKHDLPFYIDDIGDEIKYDEVLADTPETQLWSIQAPVHAAEGGTSGYSIHRLGFPTKHSHWFSLVRLWTPWLAPRHGKGRFSPDKEAIMAAFLRKDGLHVVVLAISGIDDVLTLLTSDPRGHVLIKGRNDAESPGTSRILVAVGKTFEIANAAVMYHARRIVTGYQASEGVEAELISMQSKEVKSKWLEEWADGFAFCTWNSLGQKLTEEKIYEALDSLKSIDVHITNLIIDDLWQSVDHPGEEQYVRGMTRFEANSEGFPSGLWHTVHEIRKRHPSIQHVAVWHAILGYWAGISPEGQLAKDYKTVKVDGPDWLCIDPEDVSRWYADFYSFLLESGVDSVKTDAQFMLDDLRSPIDRRRMIREYQDDWSIAMLRNFSGLGISCMSQTPQMIFHSQLPTNKPRMIVRNSDDFFPDVEDSHPWHIFCNAHNALLTQHLNVLPDWDMFQTLHPWAGFHAAARCLSGGPIYITDTPGKHDPDLIKQMTAKTPRGSTVILRTPRFGKSSQAYIGYDEPKLLKIETYSGPAQTGSSILGVFNATKSRLSEIITLKELPGTDEGEYVIRSHVGRVISKPATRKSKAIVIKVDLDVRGYEVFSATPVRHFHVRERNVTIASLGLLYKFSGAAALVGNDIYEEKPGRLKSYTSYKALGIVGFYISDLETRSIQDDFMGLMFGKPIPLECVKKSLEYENVLEIDTEQAWTKSDQQANWSNEVHVELFILQ